MCQRARILMKNAKVTARTSTINNIVKYLLIFFGIWPDTSSIIFFRVFWCISIAFIQFCQYRYMLMHFYTNDVFDLMDCFSTMLGYIKFFIKIAAFWWNQRAFNEVLISMTEDWKNCANSDIEMREITSKAKLSDHIANALVTLHTVAPLFFSVSIIFTDVDVTDPTVEIPDILKLEVPFVIRTKSMHKSILIAELIQLIISSWGMGVINGLLLTLTLHVGGQIDILSSWLKELVSIDSTNTRKSHMIRKIIQKHQKIIYFAENIERLYTFIALVQFVTNVIMICLLGFLIITAIDSPDTTEKIIRSLSYYCVTNLEAFIFCYSGEYLINKSRTIGYAAYDSAWYDMEPKNSRIFMFIILRSQKQLTLTIGKLMDLSLQRFACIMNSAGSYISVLLAMQ